MKAKITAFIDELITYDYILFGSVFGLFILFIILGIVLRKKIALAILLILLAFTILLAGPTIGYVKMHDYIFKNTTELTSQKKLSFTQAVVVKGKITNESKRFFNSCNITASANKVSNNELKNYLYSFKSFANMSIMEQNIAVGETREFKIIIEPFTYSKDFNVSIGAKCK
ncbi:hypothetical protein SMGD1_1633 [Sulfurimonas gotlandica GD1]|jgi:hypothetical protein|uniref:DUF2393 domain-containing protein n=1 Tax=Sulfurimonas gotlandica (strain DSM 19862 / JCM 16533 / GD1) TaxID=929558 RepID=B6BI05_SULGG|nr:DUF2393 domain-containing protein [Sulfurimonas gotlandica]EDZ63590.1 conserved hypothetical protein [Sulfurimonas gotlandica GD1]EHP30157.1 hypothetical protein SMGD1_1633 [Sulfurimonas gotlandica GD1]